MQYVLNDIVSHLQNASFGTCQYSRLEYYDAILHQPLGTMHILMYGSAQGFSKFVNHRLVNRPKNADPLRAAFMHPADTRKVVQARLRQFVLRTVTRCRMVDFTQHLGSATISEMQLLLEVGFPYVMHDWVQLGVPEAVVLMGCVYRPVVVCTRGGAQPI
jgi:hypothetical protein